MKDEERELLVRDERLVQSGRLQAFKEVARMIEGLERESKTRHKRAIDILSGVYPPRAQG